VAQIAGLVDADVDGAVVAADEHLRYAFYLSALSAASIGLAPRIIELIVGDPDPTMREAALGRYVDQSATRTLEDGTFDQWLESIEGSLAETDFPAKRMTEWVIYKDVIAGKPTSPERYLDATDWLQQKLAAAATARPVLDDLVQRGRTRATRLIAARRLKTLG
jgi:hypothetical protein